MAAARLERVKNGKYDCKLLKSIDLLKQFAAANFFAGTATVSYPVTLPKIYLALFSP